MIPQETIDYIHEHRNDIKKCPVCHGNIQDRAISIYDGLVKSLYEIYRWCGSKKIHEFSMKDVKHFLSKNDYARFNDLIKLSNGAVYRQTVDDKILKGYYGLNMSRLKEFYQGERQMKIQIIKDQITNETVAETLVYYWELPKLYEYLDANGIFDHERIMPVPNAFDKTGHRKLPTVEDYQMSMLS